MARRIIIDTDPGIDDAIAILLALASPELEVLGLVAVAGNRPLATTERNARALCALAGRHELAVYAGCDRPIRRPPFMAVRVHGDSGLGRLELPPPPTPLRPGHGVDFLIDAIRAAPTRTLTLCPLGPLTNIATALDKAPDIAGRIAEIVLMGGASRPFGNVTPVAEFNIHVDPDAAAIVFNSGIPITMAPLDVTLPLRTTPRRLALIRALGNRSGAAVAELLRPVAPARTPMRLHDPCVIAYLVMPELFRGRVVNVAIETESELTIGMSVIDWRGVSGRAPNARVLEKVDVDGFYALLTERLANLP